MIEEHADSITGFNATLTVNLAEKNIGATQEKFQRHTKVSKARTELNMTWTDLEGEPFRRMLDILIKYGIRDPDSQYPLAATLKERPDLLKERPLNEEEQNILTAVQEVPDSEF